MMETESRPSITTGFEIAHGEAGCPPVHRGEFAEL